MAQESFGAGRVPVDNKEVIFFFERDTQVFQNVAQGGCAVVNAGTNCPMCTLTLGATLSHLMNIPIDD